MFNECKGKHKGALEKQKRHETYMKWKVKGRKWNIQKLIQIDQGFKVRAKTIKSVEETTGLSKSSWLWIGQSS